VNAVVLDAGALIALERNDRAIWAALKLAVSQGADVLVPSTVLAQVWRGASQQAQLAKALQYCVNASFDLLARKVGELCGSSRTTDICAAHVAIVASIHADLLYTSDPYDMRRLLLAYGSRRPTIVRC
jgi:rRNA-processing protein FCF1